MSSYVILDQPLHVYVCGLIIEIYTQSYRQRENEVLQLVVTDVCFRLRGKMMVQSVWGFSWVFS